MSSYTIKEPDQKSNETIRIGVVGSREEFLCEAHILSRTIAQVSQCMLGQSLQEIYPGSFAGPLPMAFRVGLG